LAGILGRVKGRSKIWAVAISVVALGALSSASGASAFCLGTEIEGNCYHGEGSGPTATEEAELKEQEIEIKKEEALIKAGERLEREESRHSSSGKTHEEYVATVPVYRYRNMPGALKGWLVDWTTSCAGPLEIPLYRTPLWTSDARAKLPRTAVRVRLSSPRRGAAIPGWRVSLSEATFGSPLTPHVPNFDTVLGLRVSRSHEITVLAQPSAACTTITAPASSVEAWGQDDAVKITFVAKKRVVVGYRKERRVR
jgi:hypothetical protein